MPSEPAKKIPAGTPALVPTGEYSSSPPLPLDRLATLAGTKEGCHLRLVSSTVSQNHALIVTGKEGVYVRDIASRTHVLVNGKEVREQLLANGDDLRIGRFTFKFAANKAKFAPTTEPAPAAIAAGDKPPKAIDGRVLLIGRRQGCDLLIDNDRVSKCHAVVFLSDGKWHVRDLGSRTGTKVNGKPVRKADLSFGDVVRIGGVDLHFGATAVEDDLEHLIGTASLMPDESIEETPAEEKIQRRTPIPIPATPKAPSKTPPPKVEEPPLEHIDLAELEVGDPGHTSVLPAAVETPSVAPHLSDRVVDGESTAPPDEQPIPIADDSEPQSVAESPTAETQNQTEVDLFQSRRGWRSADASVPASSAPVEAQAPAEVTAEPHLDFDDDHPIGFVPQAAATVSSDVVSRPEDTTSSTSSTEPGSIEDLDFSETAPAAEPTELPEFNVADHPAEPVAKPAAEPVAIESQPTPVEPETLAPQEVTPEAESFDLEDILPEPVAEVPPAEVPSTALEAPPPATESQEIIPPPMTEPASAEIESVNLDEIPMEPVAESLAAEAPPIESESAPSAEVSQDVVTPTIPTDPEPVELEPFALDDAPGETIPAEPEASPAVTASQEVVAPAAPSEPEHIELEPIGLEEIPAEPIADAISAEPPPSATVSRDILISSTPAVEPESAADENIDSWLTEPEPVASAESPVVEAPSEAVPETPQPDIESALPAPSAEAEAPVVEDAPVAVEIDDFADFLAELGEDQPSVSAGSGIPSEATATVAGDAVAPPPEVPPSTGDAAGDLLDAVTSDLPEELDLSAPETPSAEETRSEPSPPPLEPVAPAAQSSATLPALRGDAVDVDITDRILEPEPAESTEPAPVNELENIDFSALRLDMNRPGHPEEPEMGELLSTEPTPDTMDGSIRFEGIHPESPAAPAPAEEDAPIITFSGSMLTQPDAPAVTTEYSFTADASDASASIPPPPAVPDVEATELQPTAPDAADHQADWIFDDALAAEAQLPPPPPRSPALPLLPPGTATGTGAISSLLAALGGTITATAASAQAQAAAILSAAALARSAAAISSTFGLNDGFFAAASRSVPPPPPLPTPVPAPRQPPTFGLNDGFFRPASMSPEAVAPAAFLGGMPANLPEIKGPPENFGRVAVTFDGKSLWGDKPVEAKQPDVKPAPERAPKPAPIAYPSIPRSQSTARRLTPFATEPLDLPLSPPDELNDNYIPGYTGGEAAQGLAGTFDGLAMPPVGEVAHDDAFSEVEPGAVNNAPFGGKNVTRVTDVAVPDSEDYLQHHGVESIEDFATNEFWNRTDAEQPDVPLRKVQKDLAPEIPPADGGGGEAADDPGEDIDGVDLEAADEPIAAATVATVAPAVAADEETGDQARRLRVMVQRGSNAPPAMQTVPMRSTRRRHAVPILLGTMVASMGAAVAGIWLWLPATSEVQGRLSFKNAPYRDTPAYVDFERRERDLLAAPETRLIAENTLQLANANQKLPEVEYSRVAGSVRFDPGQTAKDTDLVLDVPGKDAAGDRDRTAAILGAMYKQNEPLIADATAAVEEVASVTALLSQNQQQQNDLADQVQHQQGIIDSSSPGDKASDDTAAKQKYAAAFAKLTEDRMTLDQLDARLAPQSTPATLPSQDYVLAEMNDQIAQLQQRITQVQKTSSATPEPEARKALADAQTNFDAKLTAAEQALQNTQFAMTIKTERGFEDVVRRLTQQFIQQYQDSLEQLADWKRQLDEIHRREQQAIYDADPRLRQIRDELESDHHKLGAADAAGLTQKQRDALTADILNLEDQRSRRERELASDSTVDLRQRIDEALASNQAKARALQQSITEALHEMQSRLTEILASDSLTPDQKQAVDDLRRSYLQLTDAQNNYADASAGMGGDESLDSLQKQLADLKARAQARAKLLLAAGTVLTDDQRAELKQEREDLAQKVIADRQAVDQAMADLTRVAEAVVATQAQLSAVRDARDKLGRLTDQQIQLRHQRDLLNAQLQKSQQAADTALNVVKPDDMPVKIVQNDATRKGYFMAGSVGGLAVVFGTLMAITAHPRRAEPILVSPGGGRQSSDPPQGSHDDSLSADPQDGPGGNGQAS